MPCSAAATTTRRHAGSAAEMASVKYWSAISSARSGVRSYASVIRFRNRARMMQPPRQIRAIAPRSMSQPNSALAAAIWSKPWEYATTFDAYSACRTSSTNASGSSSDHSAACAGSTPRAASRCGTDRRTAPGRTSPPRSR